MRGGPCRHALAAVKGSAKRWETRIDLNATLEHAHRYLANHGHESAAVQKAARFVGISRAHFIRAFTERYGLTPREHILRSRMNRAVERLVAGCLVSEAALAAGYEDFNAFGRAFKRWSGKAPTAFAISAQSAGSVGANLDQHDRHG